MNAPFGYLHFFGHVNFLLKDLRSKCKTQREHPSKSFQEPDFGVSCGPWCPTPDITPFLTIDNIYQIYSLHLVTASSLRHRVPLPAAPHGPSIPRPLAMGFGSTNAPSENTQSLLEVSQYGIKCHIK